MVPGSTRGAACWVRLEGVLRWCLAALRAPRAPEGRKRADLRVPARPQAVNTRPPGGRATRGRSARPTGARGALSAARHGLWRRGENPGFLRIAQPVEVDEDPGLARAGARSAPRASPGAGTKANSRKSAKSFSFPLRVAGRR
jgi:hypothetical protein